jgi:hypothetical protein
MAEDFKTFLNQHEIDINTLSRIKHRIFVVGRFNKDSVDPDSEVQSYLFTNRPQSQLSKDYIGLFNKKYGLSFDNFVRALQPAIAEEVTHRRIPMVKQVMPSNAGAEQGTVVIDTWNYFFRRAAANSTQRAFQPDADGLEADLLASSDPDKGRSIYKQIRRNLDVLCQFQPRTPELVEVFSELLGAAKMSNDLPAYASGGALPGGFIEELIDFLYSPDLNTDFLTVPESGEDLLAGRLDLNDEVWSDLRTNARARSSLLRIVTTFRNVLVGSADQYEMRITGGATVFQKTKDLLAAKKDLLKDFAKARDAYNSLNQIVRSKVLISMVLEWVFNAHYQLEPVRAKKTDTEKDQVVAELISGKIESSLVAAPIQRATEEERHRFRKELSDNFEKVILAVLAEDRRVDDLLAALSPELREVATALRSNAERLEVLRAMAGAGDKRPFIQAQKSVIVDILMPVLNQTPIFDEFDLRMMVRREVQAAYLVAVALDDASQAAIRELGEEYLPKYLSNIDKSSRTIRNAAHMQKDLVRLFIERISNPDMADRIIEAQEMIGRAMTVIDNTTAERGQGRSISNIAPYSDESVIVTTNTPATHKISDSVANLAVKVAKETIKAENVPEKVVETVGAASAKTQGAEIGRAPSASRAPAGGGGAGGEAKASQTPPPESAAPSEVKPLREENALTNKTDSVVADFLESVRATAREPTSALTEDQLANLREMVKGNDDLTEMADDAIRSFHHILRIIYERYTHNQGKTEFVGQVQRMTLANVLLNNKETLGLGKACSNLYAMLLDAVQNMDPENPDPRKFIRDISLTRYFDNDVLEKVERRKLGVTELRETLAYQGDDSLRSTVSFMSELRGVKYLMDIVQHDSQAEVVVVNATAGEFLNWLRNDNVDGADAKLRLQSAFVKKDEEHDVTACPGLIYMTDSAFGSGDGSDGRKGYKEAWLDSLKQLPLENGNRRLVLPPICLSTGPQSSNWEADGMALASAAAGSGSDGGPVPAPVLIVGPSPDLNPKGDSFPTYLPAGYLFAAHFLCKPEQKIDNRAVIPTGEGRFQVIGAGVGQMRKTLDIVIWGDGRDRSHAFAVDFYLYILLSVLASAVNNKATTRPTAESFYPFFTGREQAGIAANRHKTGAPLDPALIGEYRDFSLSMQDGELVVRLKRGAESETQSVTIDDVKWFRHAIRKADLPDLTGQVAQFAS